MNVRRTGYGNPSSNRITSSWAGLCTHQHLCALLSTKAVALTIIARTAETSEIVGALLTKDPTSPLPAELDRVNNKFDPVFDILAQLETEYWKDKDPNHGEYLEGSSGICAKHDANSSDETSLSRA